MSNSVAATGDAIFCPANKKTKIYSGSYFGWALYIQYTIHIQPTNVTVDFEKWWNGVPYWWDDYETSYFKAFVGYTVVYATPPEDCTITVTR